jgi:hypothetical protein
MRQRNEPDENYDSDTSNQSDSLNHKKLLQRRTHERVLGAPT